MADKKHSTRSQVQVAALEALQEVPTNLSRQHTGAICLFVKHKDWVVCENVVECLAAVFPGDGRKGPHQLTASVTEALIDAARNDKREQA